MAWIMCVAGQGLIKTASNSCGSLRSGGVAEIDVSVPTRPITR